MILYHGTAQVFYRFRRYSFFTDDFTIAEHYARCKHSDFTGKNPARAGRIIMVHVPDDTPVYRVNARMLNEAGASAADVNSPDCAYNDWDAIDQFQRNLLDTYGKGMTRLEGVPDMSPDYWDDERVGEKPRRAYNQYMIYNPDIITMISEVVLDLDGQATLNHNAETHECTSHTWA